MSEARRRHFEEERGIWAERGDDLVRVLQFSDGVFAIAATLLALEIRLPAIPLSAPRSALAAAAGALVPKVLVYLLTFANIAVLWISHHRAFTHITGYDTPLLWMNSLFLGAVAFVPVASSTLGTYPDRPGAVVFYAAVLLLTALADVQIWAYATSKRRLVDEDIDPRVVRYIMLRGAFPAAVFAAAIPAALLSVRLSEAMIAAVFFVAIALGRLYSPALAHVASHPPVAREPRSPGRSRRRSSKAARERAHKRRPKRKQAR